QAPEACASANSASRPAGERARVPSGSPASGRRTRGARRSKPPNAPLHCGAMGLQSFERRLERLVEGTFAKAFRAGLEPVEIGRKIARALDTGRMIGVHGGWVVPNDVVVSLSSDDLTRFSTYSEVLSRELADAARQYARDEG